MTLQELTADVRSSERVLAPGSESDLWGDYLIDMERVTGLRPIDDHDVDPTLPDDVTNFWLDKYRIALEDKVAIMTAQYPLAPVHILDAIADYATNHREQGGFVTAVLENDLAGAYGRADSASLAGLADIVRFVHWETPAICHGSPEKVAAWLEGP